MATLMAGSPVSALDFGPLEPESGPVESTVILEKEQSPQALKIANWAAKQFRVYEKHRKSREDRWKRNYRMYMGKQWDGLRQTPQKRKTRAVINYIFSAIETMVPLETDGKYRLQYQPRETKTEIPVVDEVGIQQIRHMASSDAALADAMGQIADYQWRALDMDSKLPIASRIAKIYGTAFFYTFWNPAKRNGVGDIDVRVVEPMNVYPDPVCTRMENCVGMFYAYVIPLEEAKRMFPGKALLLKPSRNIPNIFDKNLAESYEGSEKPSASTESCFIKEYWVRDGAKVTVEEEMSMNKDEGEAVSQIIQKLKYPNGRVITICEDVLLEDKACQYPVWPFEPLYDYDIGEFWGVGEIDNLQQPQVLYNRIFSQLYDNIRLMGNPNVIADKTAGVDWTNYMSSVGQVIQKEQGTDVRMWDAPQFSPALPEFLKMLQFSMDTLSGIHDITQGRQPVGITAAQAIELLQQSAQTRIRLKIRNLLGSIRGVGKRWFTMVKLYYTEPRLLRVTGPDGRGGWLALKGSDYADADLDLIVETDSSFIVSKQGRFEQGMTLLKAGAIQPLDLLAITDWPNKEQIMQRAVQQQMAQAQMSGAIGASPESITGQARMASQAGAEPGEAAVQSMQQPPGGMQ